LSRNYKFHNPEGVYVYFVSFEVVEWLNVFNRRIDNSRARQRFNIRTSW